MNSDKKPIIPEPPTPVTGHGNLLSNVAPPSQLPNFITATVPPSANVHSDEPSQVNTEVTDEKSDEKPHNVPVKFVFVQEWPKEKFSPAIPLSKGEPMESIRSPEDSETTQSPESLPDSTTEKESIGDVMPGSGILTWMKGAMSSGGILHRVAEKAKSSVDTMITTLDPQMKEYLRSKGDFYVFVASNEESIVSPIRDGFQTVFGQAIVAADEASSDVAAVQPVGYAAAYAVAKQRIAHVRSVYSRLHNNIPVIAAETFLHEAIPERWYEITLLVFVQPSLGIELQVQSQGTPVPAAAVAAAKAATPEDYEHFQTGYSVTIGSIMGANLQVEHNKWQEASTGVCIRDLIAMAATSLAGSYKKLLAISAAET